MHFVKKGDSPDFFETDKRLLFEVDDLAWGNLHCKPELTACLIDEQHRRCIYCECDISKIKCHVEHIFPRSKYDELIFEYQNLVTSCEGGQGPSRSCGQKKGDDFDPDLFLNPTTQSNIEEFFSYDVDQGTIEASEKNEEQANYMIDLLCLNNPKLNNERKNAITMLTKRLRKHPNRKDALKAIFGKENRPFISILRFPYRKFL